MNYRVMRFEIPTTLYDFRIPISENATILPIVVVQGVMWIVYLEPLA